MNLFAEIKTRDPVLRKELKYNHVLFHVKNQNNATVLHNKDNKHVTTLLDARLKLVCEKFKDIEAILSMCLQHRQTVATVTTIIHTHKN